MADAPAQRYVTELEDSRRWRNIVRRAGDIVLCAPHASGMDRIVDIVASLLSPDGRGLGRSIDRIPWVDEREVPIERLAARLEAVADPRTMRTHSPADTIPFDRDCRYLVIYSNQPVPDSAGGDEPWRAGVERHLASWWHRRHEPNVRLVHCVDVDLDREVEQAAIADLLATPVEAQAAPRRPNGSPPSDRLSPEASAWLEQGSAALGARPELIGRPDGRTLDTSAWWHPMMRRARRPANSIDAIAERRVAEARAAGLFDDLALHGKPIPDLDRRRRPGWWADQFVRSERNKVRAMEIQGDVQAAMPALWRLGSAPEVVARVDELNERIDEYNRMTTLAPMQRLDPEETVATWRRLRSS